MKKYRNNAAVWNLTSDLMGKLRLPFLEAHRRAQAIVALEELKGMIRDQNRDTPSRFSK